MGETTEFRAPSDQAGLVAAFRACDPSERLQVALTAGTKPHPDHVTVLIAQCRSEPDFYVRDMLTWALNRHCAEATVPLLLEELHCDIAQARSQALHTLSKIGDARAWPAITDELLEDPDDEVARAAWRAAAGVVPEAGAVGLARRLTDQLGRGDRDVRLSLSRAFVELGQAAETALREVIADIDAAETRGATDKSVSEDAGPNGDVELDAVARADRRAEARLQASAILLLIEDPELGYDAALFESAL